MSNLIHDERALRSVSRAALAAYLRMHDWTKVADWTDHAAVYGKTVNEREQRIWVPIRETFADYADNMERSINVLALAEGRSPYNVLIDLKTAASDTVRIAAPHAASGQALSLSAAALLLNESLSLLIAAARSAEKQRAAYLGQTSKTVSAFLSGITPAPTEFATYDVRFLLPDVPHFTQPPLNVDDRFSRRAAVSLATGLTAVQTALDNSLVADSLDLFDAGVRDGVSANLCKAIIALTEQSYDAGGEISIRVDWSSLRTRGQMPSSVARFSVHSLDTLNAARKHLRAEASYLDEHLVADVVLLERDRGEDDGRVLLLVEFDDRTRRIEALLKAPDYQQAIREHDQKRRIELDGDLHPAGRGYELRNPHNVRLLEEPAE